MEVAGTSLVIKGAPGGTILDAQSAFRHLNVHEGAQVTLLDVQLVNGLVSFDRGGCILVQGEGSELQMSNSKLSNCRAHGFLTGFGGGIAVQDGATVVLDDVDFDHCVAESGGGAISADAGQTSGVRVVARGITAANCSAGVGGGFMGVLDGGHSADVAIYDSSFENCTVPDPEDSALGVSMGGMLFVFAGSLFSRAGGDVLFTDVIGPVNVTLQGSSMKRCIGGEYGGAVCLWLTPRPYHHMEVTDCSFIECQQAVVSFGTSVRMDNTVFQGSWSNTAYASALHLETGIADVHFEVTRCRFLDSASGATRSLDTTFCVDTDPRFLATIVLTLQPAQLFCQALC